MPITSRVVVSVFPVGVFAGVRSGMLGRLGVDLALASSRFSCLTSVSNLEQRAWVSDTALLTTFCN